MVVRIIVLMVFRVLVLVGVVILVKMLLSIRRIRKSGGSKILIILFVSFMLVILCLVVGRVGVVFGMKRVILVM